VTTSGSPTVRRRRLAAELRRLRGNRTGVDVARQLGWSTAKISRYELGHGGFPVDEVEKLLDLYRVAQPRRMQLLALAEEANQRGWWEDPEYASALGYDLMEFVGLEAEAVSAAQWQPLLVPGLLQTEPYARRVMSGYAGAVPTPPGILERRVQARILRKDVLTGREPVLQFNVVLDESVLLRDFGGSEIMFDQLRHLTEMAELPNVDLRVLPLRSDASLTADAFVIFDFSPVHETTKLADVVCTESLKSELYVEGETDTYIYRQFFEAVTSTSLSPQASRQLIFESAERLWA
jgi:Domain of unknown function (DUF5753)/Helix-turn-helix domain